MNPSAPDSPQNPSIPNRFQPGFFRDCGAAFGRVIHKDGPFLVFLAMVSGALGLVSASHWEKTLWVAIATINLPGAVQGPESGLTNGSSLESLKESLQKGLPQKGNAPFPIDQLSIQEIPGTGMVILKVQDFDQQTAADQLTQICAQILASARNQQSGKLQKEQQALNNDYHRLEGQIVALQKAHKEYLARNKVQNPSVELSAIKETLARFENRVTWPLNEEFKAQAALDNCQSQWKGLDRPLVKVLEENFGKEKKPNSFPKEEQMAREIREKERIQLSAQIEEKQTRETALLGLLVRNAVAREDVQKVVSDIQELESQLGAYTEANARFSEMKRIVEDLELSLEVKLLQLKPLFLWIKDYQSSLENRLQWAKVSTATILADMAKTRTRRDLLAAVEEKSSEFLEEIKKLDNQKTRLLETRLVNNLEQKGAQTAEAHQTVPTIGTMPLSSTRYPIFAAVFLGGSLTGFLGLFLLELRQERKPNAERDNEKGSMNP